MDYSRTVTREFEAPERAILHVEARSGTVSVQSHGARTVRIEAILHVWAEAEDEAHEAEALVVRGIQQDDQGRVIVRAPSLPQSEGWAFWGRRGARVDYNIMVPVRTAVRVLSRSGRVSLAGTEGRVHLESGSGRVGVEDIVGDVNIVARSGGTQLARVRGDVRVEARSGRIEAREIAGKLSLEARSGALDARKVTGDVDLQAQSGSVTIEDACGGVRARARTGSVRFSGRIGGDVSLSAHTGSIVLAVDPAQAFYLDAESEVGSVRSELPPRRGGGGGGEGGHKVRLRTHTGSIRITRV